MPLFWLLSYCDAVNSNVVQSSIMPKHIAWVILAHALQSTEARYVSYYVVLCQWQVEVPAMFARFRDKENVN